MRFNKALLIFLFLIPNMTMASPIIERDESAIKGLLGIGIAENAGTPIILGGDYKFRTESVDFLEDFTILVGLLHWSNTNNSLDFSALEIGGGVEKSFRFDDLILNVGGRIGFSSVKTSTSVTLPIIGTRTSSNTSTELFIAPHGEVLYEINDKVSVGGELRLPIYLGSAFNFFDLVYFMGSLQYKF